ncbi:hypothetical protein PEPS_30530 (plasmid) [Persicobacter psychrovividus]|uniref:Uncharacterized protein n=1 Tax=Persicobacter psychrovividus TaxID=387638 RepID=A0ABN6LC26_9BACT|nr:hypothetical protein PEPS_30530 [Persicobacter psychrovividus]
MQESLFGIAILEISVLISFGIERSIVKNNYLSGISINQLFFKVLGFGVVGVEFSFIFRNRRESANNESVMCILYQYSVTN